MNFWEFASENGTGLFWIVIVGMYFAYLSIRAFAISKAAEKGVKIDLDDDIF